MRRIRLAGEEDARQVQTIYAPIVRDTIISFEVEIPSVDEMARRIAKVSRDYPWLVCEDGGELLGYAYASRHRERAAYQWSVEATVYIREGQRRSGVGKALYAALFPLLVMQGYVNAYAGIALPNPGSVRLHESIGFTPIGVFQRIGFKFGAWIDVSWWQRALQPAASDPPQPIPLERVREDAMGRLNER